MIETIEQPEVKNSVQVLTNEERQTVVHCTIKSYEDGFAYRIWPTTYLVEQGTNKRATLLYAFNISFAPQWTMSERAGFTLIFEGLSKGCTAFDLKEIIPEAGGFNALNILRNKTDVYSVTLD